MRWATTAIAWVFFVSAAAAAPTATSAPTTAEGKLPHVKVDRENRQVIVECEAVCADMPLEFFVCATNTSEHEAMLRSSAKASHIHLGLLMLGLEPGQPVRFDKARNKWIPPQGPPLHISCRYVRDGKAVSVPAYRMMRQVKTKKPMPALNWVFCGSRILEDGQYAADLTGYLVTVVNFDLALIDIPELASKANETLEWEVNPDVAPARGTKVWMVIEPAGKPAVAPATQRAQAEPSTVTISVDAGGAILLNGRPTEVKDLTEHLELIKSRQPVRVQLSADPAADAAVVKKVRQAIELAEVPVVAAAGETRLSEVTTDEARIKALRQLWEKQVAPHRRQLSAAAQTHYEVLSALRREQQRLIDESDRIQRVIDELQKEYQDMTTPRPEDRP